MKHTAIDWCDSSINGSSGCDGCELWNANKRTCYAGLVHENRLAKSLPEKYAANFYEVRMIPGRYMQAANWSDLRDKPRLATYDSRGKIKTHAKPWLDGRPRHIFVGDMGDFLSRAVTDEYLERELLGAIRSTNGQRHIWMLLTKRPERLAELSIKWGGLPDNVIAMTTVTNQRTADVRIQHLLRVRAKVHMLSMEPLLGAVTLRKNIGGTQWIGGDRGCPREPHHHHDNRCQKGIDGVIIGGESGHGASPMHPDWARAIRDECVAASVWVFFKQWGEWGLNAPLKGEQYDFSKGMTMANDGTLYKPQDLAFPNGARYGEAIRANHGQARLTNVYPVGKSAAGRLLDGREWNELPAVA